MRKTGRRPRTDAETEALVLQLARENGWGGGKLHGEFKGLSVTIGETTVRDILQHHDMALARERQGRRMSWHTFLKQYRHQRLACDSYTIETLHLQTLYALFFIELGSRRVHLADCITHPDTAWDTQ